jgi:hypothetical protein
MTSTLSPRFKGELRRSLMYCARKGKAVFQIVVPAHRLFFWPVGVHDGLHRDPLLAGFIALYVCHVKPSFQTITTHIPSLILHLP